LSNINKNATFVFCKKKKFGEKGASRKSPPAAAGWTLELQLQFAVTARSKASFTGLGVFFSPSVLSPVVDEGAKSIHSFIQTTTTCLLLILGEIVYN